MKTEAAIQAKPFLDDLARTMGSLGLTETLGHVMGWLLICEPACQTIDEISRAVKIDRDDVRQHVQAMALFGLIESVDLREARGTCFALKSMSQMTEQRLSKLGEIRQITERGLTLMKDEPPEVRERLQELHDLYAQMEQAAPSLMPKK